MINDYTPSDTGGRARHSPAVREIDQLILRIRGMVRVHEHLRRRGMSDAVLEEHSAEIARLQSRLADEVRLSLRTFRPGEPRG